jgi:hypothetical protein
LIDLPAAIRVHLERWAGSAIIDERSAAGGFTPSLASLVTFSSGARIFLKAAAVDGRFVAGLRREVAVSTYVPGPALLWTTTIDGWLCAGFEAIAGRYPDLSPESPDLPLVQAALAELHQGLTPNPYPAAITAEVDFVDFLGGYDVRATTGTTLLHTDLRADNLLIDAHGVVRVVDWASAVVGAPWVDIALFLPTLIEAGHTPEFVESWGAQWLACADPADVTNFVIALRNYWERAAAEPGPVALRRYQARAARSVQAWLTYRK